MNDPERGSGIPSRAPGSASRIRRALRTVGYNVAILAVLLVPVEFGLRLFISAFDLEPPRVVEFGAPNPTTLERRMISDPDLLWVDTGYRSRLSFARWARPSLVFMGDSCTYFGRYDTELASTISKRYPDRDFTYANLGVGGWSSWSGLQQMRRDVLPLRPGAVTIYYGWNDHWNYFGLQDKDAARLLAAREGDSGLSSFFFSLRTVQAFHALKRLLGPPERVPPDDFRANLRQMVRLARDNDIVPVLLTAPTSHRRGREPAYLARRWLTDLEELAPLHERYAQIVRDVAAEEDALLVDLHGEFGRLPRQELERLFRRDGIHLTAEGDRKIAETLDRAFARAGLYERILGVREENGEFRMEEFLADRTAGRTPAIRSDFDVYLDGNELIYAKAPCEWDDIVDNFFLHAVPVSLDDLPDRRRRSGFDNLDFHLDMKGARIDGVCLAEVALPDYAIAAIRTGQYVQREDGRHRIWEGEILPEARAQ